LILFCVFFMTFYLWKIIKMYQCSGSGSIWLCNSRIRIRIN
jgi:hypothetical protein